MKKFRFESGHVAGNTLTVGEMKKKLEEYPDDMPVLAEWEGCRAYIDPGMFEIALVGKGCKEDECMGLVIDVNSY